MPSAPPRPRHRIFATCYDMGVRLSETRLAPFRELTAGEAEGRVIELGAGTGANFDYYPWARIEHLEATEPDIHMLRRAEAHARKLSPLARERLAITEAPAEALPFPDESFDTAVATLVFCTVSNLDAALAETWRVLKPGGCLRLLEHVASDGLEAKVQRFVQPVYGWMAAGCHLTRDTEAALAAAGFEVNVIRRQRFGPLAPAFAAVARKPGAS